VKIVLGTAAMMTMGCAQVPPAEAAEESVPVHGETGKTCDAAPAQRLIGRTRSAALGEEAKRLSGAAALRWIPPGTMVTADYREDRLNIELDGNNKVIRIACG
jgi:hypothetical protein